MTLDRIETFIGNVARPLSIFIATCGATAAGIIGALRIENGNDGALLLAAIGAYVGAMYGFRSVENWKVNNSDHSSQSATQS